MVAILWPGGHVFESSKQSPLVGVVANTYRPQSPLGGSSLHWLPFFFIFFITISMGLCRSDPTENDSVEGLRPNARGPGLVTFGVSICHLSL